MHRLIYAGAKGMVICRCSLSMSSAVLVMNLLKISLKDNKAEKKNALLYPGPTLGQCSYITCKIANHLKTEISNVIMYDQYFVPNFVVYLSLIITAFI